MLDVDLSGLLDGNMKVKFLVTSAKNTPGEAVRNLAEQGGVSAE